MTDRLIGAFAALSAVPLALLAFFSIHLSTDAVGDEVRARVQTAAALSAVAIQNELQGLTGLVSSYAGRPSLRRAIETNDRRVINAQLGLLQRERAGIATTFLAAPDGRLVDMVPATPSIVGKDFGFRDWYRGVTRTGRAYVSEAYESQGSGRPRVVAAAALVRGSEGRPMGILVADYRLAAIQGFVDSFSSARGVRLVVTDKRGVVLAAPGAVSAGLVSRRRDSRIAAALRGDSGVTTHEGAEGRALSAYTPVRGLAWAVVAEVPLATAFAPVDRLRSTVLAIAAVLGLALAGGIALLAVALRGRRRAERAAEASRIEAERANRAKSQFLSRMSHELRTPMNAVLGFGQLLALDDLDQSQRDSVEQILKAGDHLLALINEVLDISCIEAGRLSLSVEPVSVDEIVAEALDLIRPLADACNVVLAGAPASGEHVLGDRQRLKQVLLNLLSNAVKYNREGGSVRVRVGRGSGETVRVEVTDTGAGIPGERLDRLFTPFERLGADETDVGGTGLGLPLSKGLVEAMGGELGVESRPGEGSTFAIELPHTEDELERVVREEELPQFPVGESEEVPSRTIVYVEDNLSNLKLVEHVLATRPEIRLLAAMQGGLGLELAREHRPDLVVLDLHLPDLQGDEVLARLRADPATSEIPIVVLSADATPGRIERLLAQGADDYLSKPLDVKRFLAIIDAMKWPHGELRRTGPVIYSP